MTDKTFETVCPYFPGFYDTFLDSDDDYAYSYFQEDYPDKDVSDIWDYFDFKEYANQVGERYVSLLNFELQKQKNILNKFKIEFEEIVSPREYNFETDRAYIKLTLIDYENSKQEIIDFLNQAKDDFSEWCNDNYTSYDGFLSFIPNYFEGFMNRFINPEDDKEEALYMKEVLAFLIQYLSESDSKHQGGSIIEDVEETVFGDIPCITMECFDYEKIKKKFQ